MQTIIVKWLNGNVNVHDVKPGETMQQWFALYYSQKDAIRKIIIR